MKLPPPENEPFDLTPSEDLIITVDVGEMATIDVGSMKTRSLVRPERPQPRIDVNTLVRARQGARESAFSECQRACRQFYLSWRRGVITGACSMAGAVTLVVGAIYAWLRWR